MFAQGTVSKIDLPWGFCYQADVALKYKLVNHLQVLLNGNLFNAIAKKDFPGPYPYIAGEQKEYKSEHGKCDGWYWV